MLRWAQCGFHKKHDVTCYAQLVFLHLMGSVGHIRNSGASGQRNIDALFFILGWDRYGFNKKALGHFTLHLCFCLQWDLSVT
jgi:hypothetical protein